MDLFKKIETLLSATTRSKLPRHERHSILDEEEEKILAEIRQALQDIEIQERILAGRIKEEQAQAKAATERGDHTEQKTHERRAFELERQLDQESIQAINIEAKLAALEEKLALAKEAVEKEADKAKERQAAADNVLDQQPATTPAAAPLARPKPRKKDISARKSRLSG